MKQPKILVVDDSSTNIILLEAILEEKGYLVDTALNAKEAFKCIAKELPNLIVLDLLMPKVSGFDFLEQLHRNEEARNTPVIIVSALTDEENIKRAYGLGALDYIKKPIDIQYLVNRLEKILQ
jgi:two-component system cell cycle response regulator DivK